MGHRHSQGQFLLAQHRVSEQKHPAHNFSLIWARLFNAHTRTHALSPRPPQSRQGGVGGVEQTWDRCRPPCSQPLGPPPGTLPSENHQDSTNPPKPGAFLLSTHFSGRKWPCIQLGKQSRPLSCHGRTPASKGRVPTDTESAGLHSSSHWPQSQGTATVKLFSFAMFSLSS